MDETLTTCKYCQREWDGNAQCPCWINLTDEYLSLSDSDRECEIQTPPIKRKVLMKDASTQTKNVKSSKTPLELAQDAVNEKFLTIFPSSPHRQVDGR